MKTISMTAFNRPNYLKQTLRMIAEAKPEDYKVFIKVEPSPFQDEIVNVVKETLGALPHEIVINHVRLSDQKNQHDAIKMAFDAGSTFNVHFDDDLFIAKDAFKLADWYYKTFKDNPLTFMSYGMFNYESDTTKPFLVKKRFGCFTGLGWCIFPQNWEYFDKYWFTNEFCPKYFTPLTVGWDWNMHGMMKEFGFTELFPALARTNHAGRENGTCCRPDFYDRAFGSVQWNDFTFCENFVLEE